MVYLADVNVLVALLHAAHPHQARASAWLEARSDSATIGLCRVTQLGLLRVLTNKAGLAAETHTAPEVWDAWSALLADDRFRILDEPSNLDREWRRLTGALGLGKMIETDSYLAAFALAARIPILTFDQGFQRWPDLHVEIPA